MERSALWSPPVSRPSRSGSHTAGKANAEAIYRERRIDFDLDHLRELIESTETGPNVAFASAEQQTALRTLGREHAMPFARTQYSVDPTDRGRAALETWRRPTGTSVDELGRDAAG